MVPVEQNTSVKKNYPYPDQYCTSVLQFRCEFESRSGCGVQHYVIKLLATGLWFSLGPLVPSINKTDHHDITEILLKMALNTIKQLNNKGTCYLLPLVCQIYHSK